MSGILSGKKGIIFGALDENSIAWKTAVKSHEEGAEFILTNAPVAMRYGEIQKLAEQTNSEVVPADATSLEDLDNLFNVAIEKFGKLDFILHSIGMSINVRKGQHYTDMNYDWTQKGWGYLCRFFSQSYENGLGQRLYEPMGEYFSFILHCSTACLPRL